MAPPPPFGDEIKALHRCLVRLPKAIPVGTTHNFTNWKASPAMVKQIGSAPDVLNRALEISFGTRVEDEFLVFKSQGPALLDVTTALRAHITGTGGANILLMKWVTDLTAAATHAISEAKGPVSADPVRVYSFYH